MTTTGGGFFDDLLGTASKRRASTRAELDVAALVGKAIAVLERDPPTLAEQVAAMVALRMCGRCVGLAEKAIEAGEPFPPVSACESWRGASGVVYYAATCRGCTDWEWARMWQRRFDLASGKGEGGKMNYGEQIRLTELVEARRRAGRTVPVNLPATGAP